MAYSYVATALGNNNQSASSDSVNLVVPATAQVNDTMVVCVTVNSGTTSLVAPAGWRALRTTDDNINVNMLSNVFVKNIDASGEIGSTVTFSRADAVGGRILAGMQVVRGSDAALLSAGAPATLANANTSHTTPAATTTVDGTGLLSMLFLRVATAAPGPGVTIVTTGITNDGIAKTNFAASPNYVMQLAHKTATSAAGSNPAVSFTSSAVATSLGYRVLVPPSSSGGGGTPPVASFTRSPSSGDAPLAVTFTNTSTGSPTSYVWDFGDGTATSTTTSPSHTFTAAGTYTVSLTASNTSGSDQSTATVTVTNPAPPGDGLALFVNVPGLGWRSAKIFVNVP